MCMRLCAFELGCALQCMPFKAGGALKMSQHCLHDPLHPDEGDEVNMLGEIHSQPGLQPIV